MVGFGWFFIEQRISGWSESVDCDWRSILHGRQRLPTTSDKGLFIRAFQKQIMLRIISNLRPIQSAKKSLHFIGTLKIKHNIGTSPLDYSKRFLKILGSGMSRCLSGNTLQTKIWLLYLGPGRQIQRHDLHRRVPRHRLLWPHRQGHRGVLWDGGENGGKEMAKDKERLGLLR